MEAKYDSLDLILLEVNEMDVAKYTVLWYGIHTLSHSLQKYVFLMWILSFWPIMLLTGDTVGWSILVSLLEPSR